MNGSSLNKKGLAVAIILFVIGMSVISSTGTVAEKKFSMPTNYDGDTLYVGGDGPGNYTRIQDAIDNSSDGDTVFVYNGIYYENVLVYKSIKLIGENKEFTIIDGNNADDVICCRSDNILISGFTIQNSGENGIDRGIDLYFCENTVLENNILSNNTYGMSLHYSNYNCLSYNIIIDNYYSGLSFSHADNNLIENNYFSNNDYGLLMSYSSNNSILNNNLTSNKGSGINIGSNCYYNLIFENRIESQDFDGIDLMHSCNYNNVSGNEIINNQIGINFYKSHNNTIFGNYLSNIMCEIVVSSSTHNIIKKNILENNGDGILLGGSSDNIITANTIINNHRNAHTEGIVLQNAFNNTIEANTISNNTWKGIFLTDSNDNSIINNNFKDNKFNAFFKNSYHNTWENNFWNRPRLLPKPILGTRTMVYRSILWINFDWHPARKPYDI